MSCAEFSQLEAEERAPAVDGIDVSTTVTWILNSARPSCHLPATAEIYISCTG
jgi:hypothetical protein